jgi:hypothetical protein
MSKTLCPLPWNHLGIQQNGDLRQCCQMIYPPFGKFLDDEVAMKFDPATVDAARNHASLQQLRREMMAGQRPTACDLCWKEEAIGITSKRQSMLEQYDMASLVAMTDPEGVITSVPLAYLDLRLGNLCNLKCRSCGPADSSLWVQDHVEMQSGRTTMLYYGSQTYDLVKTPRGWEIDSADFDWHNDPAFHAWLDTKITDGLGRLYFTGGEPTVNRNHMRILTRIVELGRAGDTILEYNSNMVAIPPKLIELWRHFKQVLLGISIDAIGSLAAYVRHPSKWEAVERNCDAIGYGQVPNLTAGITPTISVFNVRHFITLSKWLIEKRYFSVRKYPSWHLLHEPSYLSIQILPDAMKATITEEYDQFYRLIETHFGAGEANAVRKEYDHIIRFMHDKSTVADLKRLRSITAKLDQIRGENLRDHLPWLADIVEAG